MASERSPCRTLSGRSVTDTPNLARLAAPSAHARHTVHTHTFGTCHVQDSHLPFPPSLIPHFHRRHATAGVHAAVALVLRLSARLAFVFSERCDVRAMDARSMALSRPSAAGSRARGSRSPRIVLVSMGSGVWTMGSRGRSMAMSRPWAVGSRDHCGSCTCVR